jgi:hypothetical protein
MLSAAGLSLADVPDLIAEQPLERPRNVFQATIYKYGSAERAKASTRREAAVDAAAAPFLRQVP